MYKFLPKKEWLEQRRNWIGASELGAILGLSKWKSPLSVYLDKVHPKDEESQNELMEWGHRLESAIADKFFSNHPDLTPVEVPAGSVLVGFHEEFPFIAASPDRLIVDESQRVIGGLECKTADHRGTCDYEAGEIPDQYVLQCQQSMAVFGVQWWWLAVLVGGNRYYEFRITADKELWVAAQRKLVEFWQMVQSKTPPALIGAEGEKEAIQRLYPSKPVTVSLGEEAGALAAEYKEAVAAEVAAKERKEQLSNKLRELMKGAEAATAPGGWKISDKEIERKEYVVKAGKYRRFDIKKAKENDE